MVVGTRSRVAAKMDGRGNEARPPADNFKTNIVPRNRETNLPAVSPLVLGCAAPIPIVMAWMDKVPGQNRPTSKTPVLYDFNRLFKICGLQPFRPSLAPPHP